MTIEPIMCSPKDAAKMLGIGLTMTYELINSGKLETVKIGRRTLVKISSIRRLAGEAQ